MSEEKVDDRPGDFGRVNDNLVGKPSQFGYLMALEGEGNSEEPVYGPKLYQYDLYNGQCKEHFLGDGTRGAEPVYAPVPGSDAENDGWVMCLVHNETSNKSRLVIIDADDFSAAPVASIPYELPYAGALQKARMPIGNWIADQQLRSQTPSITIPGLLHHLV